MKKSLYYINKIIYHNMNAQNGIERKLMYNAIMTPDGTLLVSRHRHDFRMHLDTVTGKEYGVDGGVTYIRHIGNVDKDCKVILLYSDDDFETLRNNVAWGSYGKDGNEPLHYILIKDMEQDHILAILNNCKQIHMAWYNLFEKEIEYRNKK